ncbi:unnamed protein product [Penicillium salamii]|uniref:NWD NACHT-NTPase N-terminal domain-containing protein n=1 Tax=Penicillium salamii TaxID=1612424 RepID=A0A9W4NVD5_9EURO|nr:unnamed protein product [Penicillium salamii]
MSDEELADRTQGLTDGSNGKGLWTEAREKLDPDQLQLLEAFIKDGNEDLGESAKIKLQAIKESRLAVQIGKDKVIPVRDAVKKVIETVLGYNAIITAAVSAEPHASLAWGCVVALLPILSTALSRTDSALDGLHQISVCLVRFRAIEVIYDLSEHPEEKFTTSNSIRNLHAQLRSQTIELYTKVLEYQIDLIDHYSHKQAYRAVSLNPHGDCSEIMKMAANAEKTLQTMDSVAITNVDKQLSSVMEKVKAIMDGMVQIKNNIMDVRMTQRIKELPRATFAAFDEGIEGKVPPPCYGDTRREVLQTIQDWVQDEHGSRVFWLSGMAGTGKSTIARTVAGKFHGQGYLGASFFFLKGQDDRAKTEKFFSTLARGLAETISGFDECIYESIQGSENLHHKSLKHQWESMIFRPLETLESSLLGTEAVPAIIRLFLEAKELQRIQLRILVTSRNEKHIIDSLRGEQNVAHLSLEDSPQARTTKRDISVYIDHELSEIANSKKLRDWPEAKQTEDLLQWSGNLFIAAATVCRFLEKSDFPDDKLKGFLRGNKTTDTEEDTIDYMYRHLLETAADCPDREMFLGHFQAVVGAILVSKEPMSVSEMAKFLGLDTRLITFILKRLGSVLIVPGDSNLAVQIFHLSFRDFILDKNRCKDARFFIHEAQAHKRSSGLCLDLLRTKLKKDICELHHPGAVISEIDQDRITKHISSVLQYCSQYWAFHFTDAGVSSSDHDEFEMVLEFIKEHLLHWLELLALIGRLDDAAHGILNLNAIASGHPRPGLQHFVNDAYRFILSHRSTIEEAPLQTYYMAAVFTPTDSLIREQFSKNYPAWLRKPPIMERHWGSEEQTLGFSSTLLEAFTVSFDGKSVALATNFHTSIWNVNTGNLEHIFRYNHQHESITVKSLMFSRDGSELNVIMGPSKLAKGPVEYALKSWSLITGQATPASAFTQMQSDWVFLTKLSHWKFRAGRDAVQERQAPKEEEEENPRENERSRRQKEIIARDKMLMVSFSANGAKMALFNRHMVHIGDVETREINRTLGI